MRDVRLVPGGDKAILKLSEELREFYVKKRVESLQTESALARMTFLRQAMETAKLPSVLDMAEDAIGDTKVVVFCNFNQTIDELCKEAVRRKWKHAVIRGEQDAGDRESVVTEFQRNEYDILFCNIQAGGVGLSLHDPVTKVPRTSLILPSFSSTQLVQALGRTRRAGGGFSMQHLIYFDDPFEGVIARAVRQKLNSLSLLNDAELCGDFRSGAKPMKET